MSEVQLEKLNQYIIQAIEEERARISIKVHDELGQLLTILKFGLHKLITAESSADNLPHKVNELIGYTNEIVHKVQHISQEMHPDILRKLGLCEAMDWYCKDFGKHTGIICHTHFNTTPKLCPDSELSLYRVMQEALTNVARHSKATKVDINLSESNGNTVLSIADNGIGIPQDKINACESMGLLSMQQRIKNCGGIILFKNQDGSGLKITITLLHA